MYVSRERKSEREIENVCFKIVSSASSNTDSYTCMYVCMYVCMNLCLKIVLVLAPTPSQPVQKQKTDFLGHRYTRECAGKHAGKFFSLTLTPSLLSCVCVCARARVRDMYI